MLRHYSALDVLENPENPRLESTDSTKMPIAPNHLFSVGASIYRLINHRDSSSVFESVEKFRNSKVKMLGGTISNVKV